MRVLRSWGYSLMGTRGTLVALIVEMGDNHFTFPCHIRNYSLQRNLKYLPRILLFLTECFLLSFCSQGSGGSAFKKKKNTTLFIMEIFKSVEVVKPLGQSCCSCPTLPISCLPLSRREKEGPLGGVGPASQPALAVAAALCSLQHVLGCNTEVTGIACKEAGAGFPGCSALCPYTE